MNSSPNSNEFRDFLLDRLPPEQAEAIEERIFRDDAYFSDLQDAEDELIEEYVTESLDPADARLFAVRIERDPALRERVAIRRALIRTLQDRAAEAVAAAPAARPQRRKWGSFLVPAFALAIVILFFVSWEAVHRTGLPSQNPATNSATAKGPAEDRQEAMAQAPAMLFLPAHVARGASQAASVLHVGSAAAIRLEIETPSDTASARWNVRISGAKGNVFSADGLAPRQAGVVSYVVAELPAAQLPPQVYRVTLSPQTATGGAVTSSWDLQVVQ